MTTSDRQPEADSEADIDRQDKRAAIARGRADVAAGKVLPHAEVRRWLLSWGREGKQSPPRHR